MKEQRRKMFKPLHLKPKGRLGLTLTEILVGITMSTLLIGALYGVYLVSHKSYVRSVKQAELNQNARIAMERMTRDLRQTTRIITVLPPTNTDTVNNPAPSEIEFQDGHNTSNVSYIKYYLDDTNLKRQLFHYSFSADPDTWVTFDALDNLNMPPSQIIDEDTVKADSISTLQFYGQSNLVNINLIVTKETLNYNYQTAVYARNI